MNSEPNYIVHNSELVSTKSVLKAAKKFLKANEGLNLDFDEVKKLAGVSEEVIEKLNRVRAALEADIPDYDALPPLSVAIAADAELKTPKKRHREKENSQLAADVKIETVEVKVEITDSEKKAKKKKKHSPE